MLGLHTIVLQFILADLNPATIASQIFLEFEVLEANAITEGPAPLNVTPSAPALMEFYFTLAKPGMRCCLAGSTIMSLTDLPINFVSLLIKPATMVAAFDRL